MLRRLVWSLLVVGVVALAGMHSSAQAGEKRYEGKEIFYRCVGSVVTVYADSQLGSGFLIQYDKKKWIVTNQHVIGSSRNVRVMTADGKIVAPTRVYKSDKKRDIAILLCPKVFEKFTPLELSTHNIRPGEDVYTIGAPVGLQNTITRGIVSMIRVPPDWPRSEIQHDASISSGSSGGPLLNDRCQVIGINTRTRVKTEEESEATVQNLNFAVAANEIVNVYTGRRVLELTFGKSPLSSGIPVTAEAEEAPAPVTAPRVRTGIHGLAEDGEAEKVRNLLEVDPKLVDSLDSNGWTPLHWAAFMGRGKVVALLLRYKATVDLAKTDGTTPLLFATALGNAEIVKQLLAAKADPNKARKDGQTPLYWAAMNGYAPIVKILLDGGAKVGTADAAGNTALHRVATVKAAELLLKAGAKKDVKNKKGQTPQEAAADRGTRDVATFLKQGAAPKAASIH